MQFTECGREATAQPPTSPLAPRCLARHRLSADTCPRGLRLCAPIPTGAETLQAGEAARCLELRPAAERWLRNRTPGKACEAKETGAKPMPRVSLRGCQFARARAGRERGAEATLHGREGLCCSRRERQPARQAILRGRRVLGRFARVLYNRGLCYRSTM